MKDGLRVGFERRVRPLRVGYRVHALHGPDLTRAVETATGQWGGQFHALIPIFSRRPTWWKEPLGRCPTARDIQTDVERRFGCDYIVDARLGAPEPQTAYAGITFDMLRRVAGIDGVEAGLPSLAVWRQFWRDEYRFRPIGARRVAMPTPRRASMNLFCAVCFGPELG